MSLHKSFIFKAFTCLLIIAGLAACGFQPVHGKRKTAQNQVMKQELAKIWVYEIDNREGQLLHNELLNLFNPKGRPRQPEYKLKVKYHETQSDLGISKTEFATRSNLNVSGKFEFTGPNPLSGEARAVVAFNILDSPTGTDFAKRDARNRAIKQVAREIHRRIAVHLLNTPDQTKSEKPIRIIK
jgi:LPS-assembly lipoprotein